MNQPAFPDARTWDTIQTLFDQAVDLAPAEQETFISQLEVSDEVRGWLERLLEGDRREHGLIDQSIEHIAGALLEDDDGAEAAAVEEDWSGREFGAYRTVSELGRGGMSIVMLAERADGLFEKQVALKLIKPGPFTTISNERLNEETRILARLQHPNIAHLLDAGISPDGTPFTAMEHCPGLPLTQYCDQHRLTIRQRLKLLQTICRAVHYAHGNLIVHRDLKPSNILVQQDGTPKLVDFGIAGILNKSTDQAMWATLLTPEYAAPEQFGSDAVSTASDVYALGTLLYELLTGQRPFAVQRDDLPGLQQAKQNGNYVLPSQRVQQSGDAKAAQARGISGGWANALRGDLDAIVQRALAGDIHSRYPSAQAMADDIERYLTHYPVAARAGGRGYQFSRWLRRNRLAAAAITGVIGSLAVGLGFALWQADVAKANAARAEAVQGFLIDMFAAADPWNIGQGTVTADELLDRAVQTLPQRLDAAPQQKLEALMALAEIQANMGRFQQSERLFAEAALLAREQGQGMQLSSALTHRGEMLMNMIEPEQVPEVLGEAIALTSLDELTPQAVEARTMLAQYYTRTGDFELQRQVVDELVTHIDAIGRLANGADLQASVYIVQAENLENRGEYDAAIDAARQAVGKFGQVYGGQHPLTVRAKGYVHTAAHLAGQLPLAESSIREILSSYMEHLGENNPETLWARYQLGRVLVDSGQYPAGVSHFERFITDLRELLGDEHPYVAQARVNYGSALRGAGRLEQAEQELRTGADMIVAMDGENPKVGIAIGLHARVLSELQRYPEAEQQYQRALQILRTHHGTEHPMTARLETGYAAHLLNQQKTADALALLQQVIPVLTDSLGAGSEYTALAQLLAARASEQLGQSEVAHNYLQQALAVLQQEPYNDKYSRELARL